MAAWLLLDLRFCEGDSEQFVLKFQTEYQSFLAVLNLLRRCVNVM